jgi:Rod binding domain-containing protein
MAVNSINPHAKVDPTDIPLEKLASSKALSEEQKTSEMTRQFEAVLLRQILTDAQKPAFKSKNALGGVSNAIYQDQMVNQMADKISSTRTLGLANQLQAQVSRQNNPHGIPRAQNAAFVAHSRGNPHAGAAASHSQNLKKHAGPPTHPVKALGPKL